MATAAVALDCVCAATVEVAGGKDAFWTLSDDGAALRMSFSAPVFEIGGRRVAATSSAIAGSAVRARRLSNGADEFSSEGALDCLPGAKIRFIYRIAPDSPVVRFRYELAADDGKSFALTKTAGRDNIEYFATDVAPWSERTEIRFGEYDHPSHSFRPSEHEMSPRMFENSIPFQGPMCVFSGGGSSSLLAYEHGSQTPDAFLEFATSPDGRIALKAVKGNYWNGEKVDAAHPFSTIWFEAAMVKGPRGELARSYRDFQLRRFTLNKATREPYVFYNTWASQERDKWWDKSGDYMRLMNEKRILEDVDIAHEMGVDMFVVDVSWFRQTGDWIADERRFPHGLEVVREKLRENGMKMGLWFNPTEAATNSAMMARNAKSVITLDEKIDPVHDVWATPGSRHICVVSDYWKDFADKLIEIGRRYDVTYFKWDAIAQYGCNSPDHLHGDATTSADDRHENYAFEQVRYLNKITDRICEAIPDAIVDFDVTEGGRCVGLAFLASGKYFATNNGPYFSNLDNPFDWDNPTSWCNVYVYPGPARAWVCRSSLDYDEWIPSILFLCHYIADDPKESVYINLGSLMLGQNGVWGNLQAVSAEGRRIFGEGLAAYKKVKYDVTAAYPVRVGRIGASPEIHEKIGENGNGVAVMFANEAGRQTYVTEHKVSPVIWKTDNVIVDIDAKGRAVLRADFKSASAAIVVFSSSF